MPQIAVKVSESIFAKLKQITHQQQATYAHIIEKALSAFEPNPPSPAPEQANGNLGRNRLSMTQHQKVSLKTPPEWLRESAPLIESRAADPEDVDAERSMARAIAAFNALTGNDLSETDGWLLMAIFNLARVIDGKSHLDDLKNCAIYVALALEGMAGGCDEPSGD